VDVYGQWSSYIVLGISALLFLISFLRSAWKRFLFPAGFFILCAVIDLVLLEVLKGTVGRPRPESPLGFYPLFVPGPATGDTSFPSGHATWAFILFAIVYVIPPRHARTKILAGIGLAAWGISVAVTRVTWGAHYPSDVLFGAVIPLVTQMLLWKFLFRRKVGLQEITTG
jgi:membrane-associated phospholipid phosphatase